MLLKPLLLWVSVTTDEPILTDKEKTAPGCPGNRKRTRLKIKKKKNKFFFPQKGDISQDRTNSRKQAESRPWRPSKC